MENRFAICVTVFRRPEYTKRVLDSLRNCRGIEKYSVYILQDALDNTRHYTGLDGRTESIENTLYAHAEVRRLVEEFKAYHCTVNDCLVRQPEYNLGTDLAKFEILKWGYRASDFVVFVEDDTPVAPDFLEWMEFGAASIKISTECISVTGYSRVKPQDPLAMLDGIPAYYSFSERVGFKPWTWGMWVDRRIEIFGANNEKYLNTVDDVNGRHDWFIHHHDKLFMFPIYARALSIGGTQASHTPSKEWHDAHENNEAYANTFNVDVNSDEPWLWTYVRHEDNMFTMDNEG